MYLGHDVWITSCQYDIIVAISKSCAMFVKNMAVAVYGTTVLKNSSVTCTQSNRIKNKTKEEARPKLDAAKLLAVKGIIIIIFYNYNFWTRIFCMQNYN